MIGFQLPGQGGRGSWTTEGGRGWWWRWRAAEGGAPPQVGEGEGGVCVWGGGVPNESDQYVGNIFTIVGETQPYVSSPLASSWQAERFEGREGLRANMP